MLMSSFGRNLRLTLSGVVSMSDGPNVNLNTNVSSEVNVKRLGKQQKEILRWLYAHRGRVHDQVDIIESLHGEVTDSKKASVSRSITKLRDAGVVFRRTAYYSDMFEHYIRQRPKFGLTDDGERFLIEDTRFPQITGETRECQECGEEAEIFPEGDPYCYGCHENRVRKQAQEKVYGQ